MLAGIFAFLQALPQLLALFKAIGTAVEAGIEKLEFTIHLKKFDAAEVKAQATKDTSDLEKIFK